MTPGTLSHKAAGLNGPTALYYLVFFQTVFFQAGRALAVVAPVRGGLLLAGSVQMSALNWIGGRFNRAGAGPLECALLGSCALAAPVAASLVSGVAQYRWRVMDVLALG